MTVRRDRRRKGDDRAILQDRGLTFTPAPDEPVRWLPRHGEPLCILEWFSQAFIKALAWRPLQAYPWFLPVYTAIIVTASLLILIFGVPFTEGR